MKKHLSLLLIVAMVSVFPLCVLAQSDNWTSIRALPRGTDVIVDRRNDDRIDGTVASVSDSEIVINSDRGAFIVGRANVDRIYYAIPRSARKHVNRGALIGGAVGLGVGVGVSTLQSTNSEAMPGAVIFLAGGLLGGWIGSKRAKGMDKGSLIYSVR
jgi:hypothetical protein